MRLVKNIAKFFLKKNGYDVVKLTPVAKREIYNAYYLGQCFQCIKGDPLTDHILKGKIWDSQLPEILKEVKTSNGVVIEIGANIGASILPHSKHFPELQFKLFEPVPSFYNLLKENHKTYNEQKNVEIFNLGFGLKDNDEIEINVGLGTAGKSKLVHYQMIDNVVKIKSKKIDSYFSKDKISLLKLDVDGHEMSILEGGKNLLKEQHPLIFIEFAPKVMADIGSAPQDITNFLRDLGYDQIKIWDNQSQFIAKTNDWNELLKIAKETPHYLDILVSKS